MVEELSPYGLRLALYLLSMLLFGRLLFVRPALPRGIFLPLTAGALALAAVDALARVSSVLGLPAADIDRDTAIWFATGTPVGIATTRSTSTSASFGKPS